MILRWKKLNDRCIRSAGGYQIARYRVMGVDQYHVRFRDDLIATKETPEKAKQVAQQHCDNSAG